MRPAGVAAGALLLFFPATSGMPAQTVVLPVQYSPFRSGINQSSKAKAAFCRCYSSYNGRRLVCRYPGRPTLLRSFPIAIRTARGRSTRAGRPTSDGSKAKTAELRCRGALPALDRVVVALTAARNSVLRLQYRTKSNQRA